MSSDSQDSSGEDLPMVRPTLIRELRNVLDSYPDDGQILKELIQNAEDAGASVVKILTDKRTFNQQHDDRTLRRHAHLKFFQGPALAVYNDAEFSDDDWEGIRMLHTSIKEKDPLKVGRFGLGFKSVFHLTDRLVILSGNYIMYMDPFKGEEHYCKRRNVGGRKGRELRSILESLQGIFGVRSEIFQNVSGRFPGTLFWFPLRQHESSLSSTVYAEQHLDNLLASFRAEAPSLLLFLNHVERVTVYTRDGSDPEEVFSVGIASSCLKATRSKRRRFISSISSGAREDSLPEQDVFCVTEVTMETTDCSTSSTERQQWLIANYHCGRDAISPTLRRLCSDPQLSYQPYVGVAIPLTDRSSFQSQLYCFLPLPLDTRSPTGLPVHVHGYFALEQNRRHLKWPSGDQLQRGRRKLDLEAPVLWNCLLVAELLPKVYCEAILRLHELSSGDPDLFFQAWPDAGRVTDRWRLLLEPLYNDLAGQPLFYSHTTDAWVFLLGQAVLQRFDRRFSQQVQEAVVKVYAVNDQHLVHLPDHVLYTLQQFCFLEGVEEISPTRVCELIPSSLPALTRSDRLSLLQYLSDYSPSLLVGQPLLPLATGDFGLFESKQSYQPSIKFWCPGQMIKLFPGLEAEFCDHSVPSDTRKNLQRLVESGTLAVEQLKESDKRIPELLQRSLQIRFQSGTPALDTNDHWLELVWKFLAKLDDILIFGRVPLLPTKSDRSVMLLPLIGEYVCGSARGMSTLSQPLASALTKLGVTVLHDLPQYITSHKHVLGHFVSYPTTEGILTTIQRLSTDTAKRANAVKTFNSRNTRCEERKALVQLLSRASCRIPDIFKDLKLFPTTTGETACVNQVVYIAPLDLPSISFPEPLLDCSNLRESRPAALKLGAEERTLTDIVCTVLQQLTTGSWDYSEEETILFMQYFLQNKHLLSDSSLLHLAKEVKFVKTKDGTLKKAAEVYEPSQLLQELFHPEHGTFFLSGEFSKKMTQKLKKLGLRTESDVRDADLISSAKRASKKWRKNQHSDAKKIARGLWTYLNRYGEAVREATLHTLSSIQCLPCLQSEEKPTKMYPASLPVMSSPLLVKPAEMCSYHLLSVVGSVLPVLKGELTHQVARSLQVTQNPLPDDIVHHLVNVTQHFQRREATQYRPLLHGIFQALKQYKSDPQIISSLREQKCILVDSADQFVTPDSFWTQEEDDDIKDLHPYRFRVPVEMKEFNDLLEECGSSQEQDDELLQTVLGEIELKYRNQAPQPSTVRRDFQVVKQILDKLQNSDAARARGDTLLPVTHNQCEVLQFKPARECTVKPGGYAAHAEHTSETYFYVHADIPIQTALNLGALLMTDRALTGVEGLDFGYSQREDLTSRLHKLLHESYTDGFSVPKELVQNADDARASKVFFLLDERDNPNARTNLISDAMAGLQGPAIWVYNDAVFSDTDFANIIKLGGGTKKEDTSRVGRFGLGFNAVYNWTDVPCFLSRTTMAMFDPQVKYLGMGAGLKLDFTKPINQDLLARMPEQFLPFQGVFGCHLQSGTNVYYDGTLFRFPLRTEEQTRGNKLKSENYSESKRREFLKMLLDRAGSLLMFTQSVTEVQVFHLPPESKDPCTAKRLLTVSKSCELPVVIKPRMELGSKVILQFMKDQWSKQRADIQIQQKVCIAVDIAGEAHNVCDVEESESSVAWQVAWASGVNESAYMVSTYAEEGLVPLAAVAVPVSEEGGLRALEDSPPGFYKTGHLFCFLPLPEEQASATLPVHINGTFALTSDRRGLVARSKEEFAKWDDLWNKALYRDAVCRAYLLALELVQAEAMTDFEKYFDLWPKSGADHLVHSFYDSLMTGNRKVLPVPGTHQWICFQEACFLQPEFRDSACGDTAWQTLQKFWRGSRHLVDIPSPTCKLMEDKGPTGLFRKKTITELEFFKDFFFPNLHSEWWQHRHNDRDSLIHHALKRNHTEIDELIKANRCIPCEGGELRKPSDLVHPTGQVATMYQTSEGRFPRKADANTEINFCDNSSLQRLTELGMIKDELPWKMVLDRAESVGRLNADEKPTDCLNRAGCLVYYLSGMGCSTSEFAFDKCPPDILSTLSQITFLPVLGRPENWPFEWNGDRPTDTVLLARPEDLFSSRLKNLVACKEKLLDTEALQSGMLLPGKTRAVLKTLGVVVEEDFGCGKLLTSTVQQLLTITDHSCGSNSNKELIQNIAKDIYSYLKRCLARDEGENIKNLIQESVCDKKVVWNGMTFVQPSVTAFVCPYNCSPHLFQLEVSLQQYKAFFEAIGVKNRFETTDVLAVLEKLKQEHADAQLSDSAITTVSQLAQLLGDIMKRPPADSLDAARVFLPDRHGILQSANHLCVDDCPSLIESDQMKFVHGMIPVETARLLGVKTKRRQDYDLLTQPISVPFGQHEELTSRIKRLLQGYTFDSSLCKELLQNAEDAGATESMFIMDFRHLGSESVPVNFEGLQGPALCFYNNRSFTRRDMEGIQNLGAGSKSHDALKIGQFGVGFNSVFHVTDVPSFWTREDDEMEVICVLDPNCSYVPNTEVGKPGVKFTDVDRVRTAYHDFFSGYQLIDMTQPGTLFRLPLRTQRMASSSSISQKEVSEEEIRNLLQEFRQEIHSSLLFLNNLQKVGIYIVQEDGSLHKEVDVIKSVDDSSKEDLDEFKRSLEQACEVITQETGSMTDISPSEAVVQSELTDSSGHRERWLAVHRVGFIEGTQFTSVLNDEWRMNNFRLLPRGGVAVKLESRESAEGGGHAPPWKDHYQAFCMLPLPIRTKLPMHVNGHFALDHETRRNLWDAGSHSGDKRSEWNEAIARLVIVPAYISALQHVKSLWFPVNDHHDNQLETKLKKYHALFPKLSSADSKFWHMLMVEIYKELARNELLTLFPVTHHNEHQIEWMSVVKEDGFPGYFNNIISFFKDERQENQTGRPVLLSQGGSVSHTHTQPGHLEQAAVAAKRILQLLKELNMKVLDAPFDIFESFKASGVEAVQEVTPQTVLQFLQSAGQGVSGGCNIVSLPAPVSSTPLKKVQCVTELIAFVSKESSFLDKLDGLPLCLRQSGTLHTFSCSDQTPKPIISEFSKLLPGSSEEFLHKQIRHYFQNHTRTHTVIQQLNIPMLASRLKDTLTDSCFSAGMPCALDEEKLPFGSWTKDLWKFLGGQIEKRIKENSSSADSTANNAPSRGGQIRPVISDRAERRRTAEEMLQSLQDWCLIPVKTSGSPEKSLYPIKMLHHVVHLTHKRDESNGLLWGILKKLPLPFLDPLQLPPLSIADKLVASITHPRALLHALASCADQFSATHEDGFTILDYFAKNLDLLQNSCSQAKLEEEMLSLPVFPMINDELGPAVGSTRKLCLSSDIPGDRLTEWSRKINVILLRKVFIPAELSKFLHFQILEDADFYSKYLLRSIHSLSFDCIVTHMEFLRKNFFLYGYNSKNADEKLKQLCLQLKATAFINVCGTLHRAQDFYTPHHPVFSIMCAAESFPPQPYFERKWEHLLVAAGIIFDITDDMFLQFAREVEREGNANITDKIHDQSYTLVSHLFAQETLTGDLLNQVRSIRFLSPSEWMSTKEGEKLKKIAPPFQSTHRLVSFCDSCFEENLQLVWSSSDVLHETLDPRRFICRGKELKTVMSQLCMQDKPPLKKVIQHAKNICRSLGGDNGPDRFASFQNNKRPLIIAMETLYRYLEDNAKGTDINVLKGLPLICDVDNRQMLLPAVVVIDVRPNEMIRGHIEKAPFDFGRYFNFFEKLGATKCVTASHYADVLQCLKTRSGDKALDVEELKIVKSAVHGLFRCLRDGTDEQKKIRAQTLYLPTEEKRLEKSTEIIFKDRILGERFQNQTLPDNVHFFLGFERLELEIEAPLSAIKQLPENFRLVLLSEVVQEKISDEVVSSAEDAHEGNPLVATLSHPLVQQAVLRLACHECLTSSQKFDTENVSQILQQLGNISIKVVSDLKTILTLYKQPVEETERKLHSFTDMIHRGRREAVVYISEDAVRRWPKWKTECLNSLYKATAFVVPFTLDRYLMHHVLKNPLTASRILDDNDISQCSSAGLGDVSVFPPPGDFVPVAHHCHLENIIFEFHTGEHVGFEAYDPEVDIDERDDHWDGAVAGSEAVYIYGIVCGEVRQDEAGYVSRVQRCYRVDLGHDRGVVEVNATKLYKFCRPTSETSEPQNDNVELRKVRELLAEAWQLGDASIMRRVVKRLLLHCPNHEGAISHYVSLLEAGQELPCDDDDSYDADDSRFCDRPGSFFSQSFFTNIRARGRCHRDSRSEARRCQGQGSRSSGYSSYGTSSGPNPQAGEGRRWIRQAQADVTNALAARESGEMGHNWVCYLCHQAVEKALKAVLFKRDCDSFDRTSHDILFLAEDTRDAELRDLAHQLEQQVGPHVRMRYPDALSYPRIPASVYSEGDASLACDLAARTVARVLTLMQVHDTLSSDFARHHQHSNPCQTAPASREIGMCMLA